MGPETIYLHANHKMFSHLCRWIFYTFSKWMVNIKNMVNGLAWWMNIKNMVNGLALWSILVDRGLPMQDPWDTVYLPRFTPTTINMSPSFFRDMLVWIVDFCWVNVGTYTVPCKPCVMIVLLLIFKSYLTTMRWAQHSLNGNLLNNYTHAPCISNLWPPGLEGKKLLKLIGSSTVNGKEANIARLS